MELERERERKLDPEPEWGLEPEWELERGPERERKRVLELDPELERGHMSELKIDWNHPEVKLAIRLEIRAYLHEYLYAMETKHYDPYNAVEEAFNTLEFEDELKQSRTEQRKKRSEDKAGRPKTSGAGGADES